MFARLRHLMLGPLIGSVLLAASCDRKSEIHRALPSTARDVRVSRTPAPGSLEGDSTYVLEATFPDPAACQSFISAYAPREKLAPVGSGFSRDVPGHESWHLECSAARMKYEHMLY